MASTTQDAVNIISSLGGGAVLATLVGATVSWFRGRPQRERSAVEYERKLRREAEARADEAERQIDHEAAARRRQAEFSSRLIRLLIQKGIPDDEIPQWPVDAATIPRAEANRLVKESQQKDQRFKR